MAWIDDARIIDVSHWNRESEDWAGPPRMDWAAAVRGGCVGAIIKYSQGAAFRDPAAFLHTQNAYKAGVPLLGAYHFGDGSDPTQQAASFLDLVNAEWGGDISKIMLMLDAERNPRSQMSVHQAELFAAAVQQAVGRWPWLYMGRGGPDGTGKGLPNTILANCPLLLPKYGPPPKLANLPRGWRFPADGADCGDLGGLGVVRGWQFTDGSINGGPFPGLGRVDQSRLIGFASLDEARAAWAG